MRLLLRAAGSLKSGPERALVDDYIKRAAALARSQGFHSVEEQEVSLRGKADATRETEALLAGLADGTHLILLDERGKSPTSEAIAAHFARLRDEGASACCLMVGPAEGFDKSLLPKATVWSFGALTWPHRLVRVMAAEQLYRALTILAGSPYHKA